MAAGRFFSQDGAFQMNRNDPRFVALITIYLLATATLWPTQVTAESAVAVGIVPGGVAQGYAIGFGLNYKTMDLARQSALDACHNSTGGAAKERCEVVATFHNQCVASAIDPKAGTPGAGWAIGDTQKAADDEALSRCRNTAGADRIAFCKIEDQLCDGDAK